MRHLLLDLDNDGGTDPLGVVLLFLKRTADVTAPRLSVVFRRLVRLGSFPACWRQANVTPIPKGRVGSSWTIYGTQWCPSNHPVCSLARFRYL